MSNRKTNANRENGKLGGPKTPAGKAKASLNALKHGLAGETIVLTNESRRVYDAFLTSFLRRFKPADEVELDLVTEMANNRWRLRRICGIETALLDLETGDQKPQIERDFKQIDEITRTALAFKKLAEDKALALLNRYEARFRRSYSQAFANFRELRADFPFDPDCDEPADPMPSGLPDQPITPAEEPPKENDQTNPPAPPEGGAEQPHMPSKNSEALTVDGALINDRMKPPAGIVPLPKTRTLRQIACGRVIPMTGRQGV